MLVVTGHLDVAPCDVDAFMAELKVLARATRLREGCLLYAAFPQELPAGRIAVFERWTDQPLLSEHLHADDTGAFLARWKDRMTGSVLKFDAINPRPVDAD